ncbi:MAG: M20/M25/M40 family metallo-hydrolase [Candidatus Bathyarchaeia archaeon]
MRARQFKDVEQEVTSLLSDLIRINTVNPPGNETEAAKYLANCLEKDGFKCEVFESSPGRGNIITRLKGTREKPSLLLLSHLDVVAANPREWSVNPFSGVIQGGFVWGRGALDMKSMTAIEVMVMKLLKRNNVKLKGDVILAATADEEGGGGAGAGWLVHNYPEKIRADFVINEGGGLAMPINGKNLFTIQTAEKGALWFKVKARGIPGHGSMPGAADNAIIRMGKVLEKIGSYHPKIILTPIVKLFLSEVAEGDKSTRQNLRCLLQNPNMADEILDSLAQWDKGLAEEIRAMLRMTIAPTIIHGGLKENVIPSECEATFDCRILPSQSLSGAMDEIKRLLFDVDAEKLEFEILQAHNPSESPINTPLYEAIVSVLKEFEANCSVAPLLLTGLTDSRFFREMGSICYGFQPMRADMPYGEILRAIHGVNERISIENLVFGTSVLYNLVEKFMS